MANKSYILIPLFKQFINDSYKGKRLKPDGKKIRTQTVDNYQFVLQLLQQYEVYSNNSLCINTITTTNKKVLATERNYWKKFYWNFTQFLYIQKNCFDNFVGNVIKVLRVFFNYLQKDKLLPIGNFYKSFYVCKEEVPIITLLPQQLQFLIYDKNFSQSLPLALQYTKDTFVFGCTVALRSSDLFALKFSDIEYVGNFVYLSVKTIKTNTAVRVKLPDYCIEIIEKYRKISKSRKTVFAAISKNQFNKNIKKMAELAGWIKDTPKMRSKRGKLIKIGNEDSSKFCNMLSSHTMRRTAITTMLMLGMPEHVVKKISGHAANSKEFYRYVNLVQSYLDTEVDKVFNKLNLASNI